MFWAYFNWQFFTGMRPEEAIALPVDHIDFESGTALVERVRTAGEDKMTTKTHFARYVDINERARQSLEVMHKYWGKLEYALVFERPEWRPQRGRKGKRSFNRGRASAAGPWSDERSQRETYWQPTLQALGIRYRRPYNTRHTYATIGLMNGVDPSYMADQLGHDKEQFFGTYTKWGRGEANKRELEKINQALGKVTTLRRRGPRGQLNLAQIRPIRSNFEQPSEENVGRRDWTRTNDPHHVKVVL